MTKVLEATCIAGVVKVGTQPVLGATLLSEGLGSSSGLLVLEADGKFYIANTSPDLSTALSELSTALTQIASALTVLDQKPVGGVGSAPVPAVAGNVTAISAAQSAIDVLRGILK